ncbi:MAG: TetR/AcrR family transcriptional regulator [Pseudomonadota bacterium]
MDASFSSKELEIVRHALELLVEAGDAGLTMRQLAARADMRLSNVQYYFKSREDILKAMVSVYFQQCIDDVTSLTRAEQNISQRERLHYILREGLKHGQQISDLCRTFRELWAISSRNPEVHECLVAYYRSFGSKLIGFAVGDTVSRSTHDRLVTLIVPYIEGYSITASALPCDVKETTDLITDIAMAIIGNEEK